MSLITDESSRSVAETFDLFLIDLASVFGKIINAEKVFRRRGQDLVYFHVCTPSSILQSLPMYTQSYYIHMLLWGIHIMYSMCAGVAETFDLFLTRVFSKIIYQCREGAQGEGTGPCVCCTIYPFLNAFQCTYILYTYVAVGYMYISCTQYH